MSVLRSAAELFYTSDLPWEEKTKYTLTVAQRLEKYVIGPETKAETPASEQDTDNSTQSKSNQESRRPAVQSGRKSGNPSTQRNANQPKESGGPRR